MRSLSVTPPKLSLLVRSGSIKDHAVDPWTKQDKSWIRNPSNPAGQSVNPSGIEDESMATNPKEERAGGTEKNLDRSSSLSSKTVQELVKIWETKIALNQSKNDQLKNHTEASKSVPKLKSASNTVTGTDRMCAVEAREGNPKEKETRAGLENPIELKGIVPTKMEVTSTTWDALDKLDWTLKRVEVWSEVFSLCTDKINYTSAVKYSDRPNSRSSLETQINETFNETSKKSAFLNEVTIYLNFLVSKSQYSKAYSEYLKQLDESKPSSMQKQTQKPQEPQCNYDILKIKEFLTEILKEKEFPLDI